MTYSNYSGDSSGSSSSSDGTSYNSTTDYTTSESTESTASTDNYSIEAESFSFSASQLKYSPVHRTDDVHNRFYNVDLTEYVIEPLEGGPPGENVYGDPDPDIQDLLDQLLQAIKDEIEDRLPEQIIDKLVTIKECLGDDYNLKDSVAEYNDWEQNRDEDGNLLPQFPNCPDEQFVYPSGWDYVAERTIEFTGAVPDGVLKMRSAKVGPPDKTATAESHNPGRILNLPKDAVTMIHNEPVKLFWVHPYLERGEEHKNDEDDEDHNLAFSKYNQNSKWQSGPVSNSPTNSDCLLNSGFWTQAAGLQDVPMDNPEETKLYFRRAYQGHDSSLYRIGYSRGNDTVLYGDSGTEGMEYGCVGMSGFFTALPNEAFHDDKYNVGVEHAYTINRICTSLDELGYNIKKFVEWLQDLMETLEDLDIDLPEGIGGASVSPSATGEYTPGSIRLDPTDLLSKLRSDPDADPTKEELDRFGQLTGKLEAIVTLIQQRVDNNQQAVISPGRMMERGYIQRMKSIPWNPTPQELGILEMIFEFAGRVIPENDGVPESKKQFNVNIDSLVERLERGEPLTRLDVIRSYFTRVGLQNERLARAVGDFDLEKFGKYELGLIDKKEVANERFFLFLVGELRDYISDFKYNNGDLEVVYKTGFRWKASDFAQGVKGFIEACDRMGCNTMMTDGRIYVYLPTSDGLADGEVIAELNDFDDYYFGLTGSVWSQERETRDNESVYQDKTEHYGVEGDKQRLLFSEINPNTNKRRYAHPGDKIDHIAVTYQGDTEPKDYQRWTGGYCYPVGGQSALAQPSWDRWVDADVKGTAGRYSWDCTNDPEKVWYTHTYGPFKKHEMEKYYFFVIPRRRHEEPRPMSYGLLWWWSNDPKARAKDWKTAKGGAKSPIDAYHPWVTPETEWQKLENLKYEGKSYYRMKPPAKYFRVSFYQWVIGLYEYENWEDMRQRLLDKGVDPLRLPKNIKGKLVEDDLWPPHQCGPLDPGHPDGNHPHGVWFPFSVYVANGDKPWKQQEPATTVLEGPVYWTNVENKVAELANDHYDQPVNILEPFERSGFYRFTPVENIKHDMLKHEDTPLMTIHESSDLFNDCRDPQTNPGYRNRYGPHMTHIRRHERILKINNTVGYSAAGFYPFEEIGDAPGGARQTIEQWNKKGEPWLKIEPIKPEDELEQANNGPAYWGTLAKGNARPNFHNEYWQTPLNYFGSDYNLYREHAAQAKPFPHKRLYVMPELKGKSYKNPLTDQFEDWETKEDYDVYFIMQDACVDIGLNRYEYQNPRVKFKYAGTIRKGNDVGFSVTCPTDKMIFAALDTTKEFGPKEMVDWNVDGERINLSVRETKGDRDDMYGPAYWTDSGSTIDLNRKTPGVNGCVDFHDLYWDNPVNEHNSYRVNNSEMVRAGNEYTITYKPGPNDKGNSLGGNADSRVRLIWGKLPECVAPCYRYDPGFGETTDVSKGEKRILDEVLYDYSDIILEPNKPVDITAESDYLFFGVFSVTRTPGAMGSKEIWSIHGQELDITIEDKKVVRGCSLFVSSDSVYPIPPMDNRTITQFGKYKVPYMHLTQEIAKYKGKTDPNLPAPYDGGKVPLVKGRKYKLSVTDYTPERMEYRLFFVNDGANLSHQVLTNHRVNDPNMIQQELVLKRDPYDGQNVGFIEFEALSDYLMLEAWNARKPLDPNAEGVCLPGMAKARLYPSTVLTPIVPGVEVITPSLYEYKNGLWYYDLGPNYLGIHQAHQLEVTIFDDSIPDGVDITEIRICTTDDLTQQNKIDYYVDVTADNERFTFSTRNRYVIIGTDYKVNNTQPFGNDGIGICMRLQSRFDDTPLTTGQQVVYIQQFYSANGQQPPNLGEQPLGDRRTYQDWSDRGEPAYLKLEYAETGVIKANQYWTDAGGNDANKANALKDKHWKNPMHPLMLLGTPDPNAPNTPVYEETKPNKKYEIEVIDRDDNPDYLHKIWIGPKPGAYDSNTPVTYISSVTLRKGETKTFETNAKNFIVMLGAEQTQRQLNSWNNDGEPLYVKFKEVYKDPLTGPVYPGNHMDKPRAEWNQWLTQAVQKYGENQMFGNPMMDVKKEDQLNNTDAISLENQFFQKTPYAGEATTDNTPQMIPGRRYRIKPPLPQNELLPQDYADDIPYGLRVWNFRMHQDIFPTVFNPSKVKGDRVFFPQRRHSDGAVQDTYCDFVAEDQYVCFGAVNMYGRDFYSWSDQGEPTNVEIELLPNVPINGPAYWTSPANQDRPPAVEDEHFLKPLNIYTGFISGKEYQAGAIVNQMQSTTRIWWVMDTSNPVVQNAIRSSTTNLARETSNCPLDIDPRHPEDLIAWNDRSPGGAKLEFQWEGTYRPGPILEYKAGGDPQYFTVPDNVVGAIFAVFKTPAGGGGGTGGVSAAAANDATNNMTDWSRDGQPLQWEFTLREPPNTQGPVYWGDTATLPGKDRPDPGFVRQPYFSKPLSYMRNIPKNSRLKIKNLKNQYHSRPLWEDYSTVDVYAFNTAAGEGTFNDVLDPSSNLEVQYFYLCTLNENDDEKLVDVGNQNALVLSARNMKAPKRTLTDWSPKGEPEPIVWEKMPEVVGPVYWADSPQGSNDIWARGLPNFGRYDKWKGKINAVLLEEGATYIMTVTKQAKHDYWFWFTSNTDALDPQKSQRGMWHDNEDLPSLSDFGGQLNLGTTYTFVAEYRYLVYGATNTGSRTFQDWSPKGEPDIFKFDKQRNPKGPAYPAQGYNMTAAHGRKYETDWEHKRWTKPLKDEIEPGGLFTSGTFIPGLTYDFKVKETKLDYHYDAWWVQQVGNKDTFTFEHSIKTPSARWSSRGQGQGIFLSFYDKVGAGEAALPRPQSTSMSKWSPDGYPFRLKVTIDWTALIPPGWWKWLLLLFLLLLALLAIYMYLTATAPLDVLLEMAEEHEENEYPIVRWKQKTDEQGNVYGYGYPFGREYLEDRFTLGDQGISCNYIKDWTTQPKFFNYTADYLARAWAKIMKLRMNGYLFHLSRNLDGKDTIIKSSYTAQHALTISNLSQTFGIGYSKLQPANPERLTYRKIFREYKEWPADRNINRYNPFNFTGVDKIKLDLSLDDLRQRGEWRDDMKWFDPALGFCHFTKQDEFVYSRGGARYKSAMTISSEYNKVMYPIGGGSRYGPDAMFCSLGYGAKTDHFFTSNTSSHAFVWEVLVGDKSDLLDAWPGLQDDGIYEEPDATHFIPIIEFDFDDIEKNIQLVQIHVNFEKRFAGTVTDTMAVKMMPENSSQYKMRDSFDNTSPNTNLNQGSVKNLRLKGTTDVPLGAWRFCSISFCFWIGTNTPTPGGPGTIDGGTKGMLVKNLKADRIFVSDNAR